MVKSVCIKCGQYKTGPCPQQCTKLEAQLKKEGLAPIKSGHNMIKNIDARRKIVPGNKYVADNDQNVEWDTKSFQDVIEDIVMDDKMYKIIRKHATVCDHKSRRKRKRLFFAFIRCAKEKELAERAGCTPENIRKYLARMFTCIVRRLAKDNQEEIVKLTPTGYKRKWIHGTP